MAKRGAHRGFDIQVNLTPMIDLTFLLVMFFVLTSQFVTLNLEDVLLPVALQAAEQEKDRDQQLLIINIKKTNDATREGKIVFNVKSHTLESLTKALQLETKYHADRHGWEDPQKKLSKLHVIVRADEGVQGKYLRQVFTACQRAGLWKVKLSSIEPES